MSGQFCYLSLFFLKLDIFPSKLIFCNILMFPSFIKLWMEMKGSEGLLSFMMAPVFVRIHFTIYSVESEFGSTIKFHVQLILAMFDLNHICCRYFKSLWHSWMCCNYANNSRSYGLVWLSWTMDNDLRLGTCNYANNCLVLVLARNDWTNLFQRRTISTRV